MDKEETALDLWRRWFESGGDPYYIGREDWPRECFFCENEEGEPHEPDCIFVLAKKLLEAKSD